MKAKAKRYIYEYTLIAIGTFVLALGLNLFLVPKQFSAGGVSAVGTVLYYLLGIPLFLTNLVCNVVLLGLGFKFIGRTSIFKTVAGILFLSVSLAITSLIPAPDADLIMSVVCGGVLIGGGVGLVIRVGGSTGGSDLAGLMIKKLVPHIPIAVIIFILDIAVIAVSGIVFASYSIAFYSALAMFISSKVADLITNMGDAAKSLYIMSDKNDKIAELILREHDRGVTEIYSKGAYSGKERKMLLCVMSPKEAPALIKTIKNTDPAAFIIITDAREVLGEGFKYSD